MMLCYYLHFFRCESTLPANFFVVALVLLSLRALLASVPTCFDVVRHDFEHAIFNHLLPLRRYRVGLKLWVYRHWNDAGIYSKLSVVRKIVMLAHWNNVLFHSRVLLSYMGSNCGRFCASEYRAVNLFGGWNPIEYFPHIQPSRSATAVRCSSNVLNMHGYSSFKRLRDIEYHTWMYESIRIVKIS